MSADTPASSVILANDNRSKMTHSEPQQINTAVHRQLIEANPPTLDRSWSRLSCGICRLDGDLMVILNVDQVLDVGQEVRPA